MISLSRWLGQGFQLVSPLTFGFSAHTTANVPLKVNTGLLNLIDETDCQRLPNCSSFEMIDSHLDWSRAQSRLLFLFVF